MKLKRTLAIIMTAAMTVGTMAGCSQATLNYSKELSNTAKWEAMTSDMEGKVNVDVKGVKEEVTFTATSYKANDKAYVEMKFNNTSGKIKFPEIKEYVDGNTIYINKSYFEGIYGMTGQPIPEGLANIKEEYIAIDSSVMGMNLDQLKTLASQPEAMIKIGKLVFGENTDLDLPFVQNGREYTLNLDADKTVDLSAKAIKAASNNLDKINTTFLGSKLTAENIAQIKTSVNDAKFDATLPQIKATLAGSTIASKEKFTDNSYNADINVNLQIKDLGTVSLVVKSTSNKSEVKAITLPTSKIKLSQEEFVKLNAQPTKTNTNIAATTNVIAK
ncbi:hypothetical protein [Clostridium sp. C2-6-12]|uniref:hypothetical protein n=1 Tax=Clostridium sp. C2-6-12 TaxID=2698832 RepID=UPI00136F28E4|nr:hypothetical protein [Clostridium sp. C2-6-12]